MNEVSTYDLSFGDTLLIVSIALPLFSFIFSFFVSDRYSWAVPLVATLMLLSTTIVAIILVFQNWNAAYLLSLKWFSIADQSFDANMLVNNQSLIMLLLVSLISFLVHFYSVGYMAGDANVRRYFGLLGLFTFSMQGIVLSDSLLAIYFFWELVGFSSYVLIGHYTADRDSGAASKKAFIMNRIGDAGFVIGLLMIWTNTGTLNLSDLASITISQNVKTTASMLIFFAAIAKSAQFPLLTWLPDAMKGPTPVSALLHAATMVAAGVYVSIRLFGMFTEEALFVVTIIGVVTALIGALSALAQFNIKKILAFSTVSQLGLMFVAIGASAPDAAFLHLFTHAFFKACLFLCAGAVIHSLQLAQQQHHSHFDPQDIRNMGNLSKKLPGTFKASVLAAAGLSGVPFFAGFLSKEAILNSLWLPENTFELIVFTSVLLTSFLTVLYTYRFVWFVFLSEPSQPMTQVPDTPIIMRIPIIILAIGSLWFAVSFNPFNFNGWIYHADPQWQVAIVSTSIVLIGLVTARFWIKSAEKSAPSVLRNTFYIDAVYSRMSVYMINPLTTLARNLDLKFIDRAIHFNAYATVTSAHLLAWFDKKIIDGIVHLSVGTASAVGALIRSFQAGKIQLYIFWAMFAVIIFLIWSLI
jgi:NADH-quinone oxidoreductase subunit L